MKRITACSSSRESPIDVRNFVSVLATPLNLFYIFIQLDSLIHYTSDVLIFGKLICSNRMTNIVDTDQTVHGAV